MSVDCDPVISVQIMNFDIILDNINYDLLTMELKKNVLCSALKNIIQIIINMHFQYNFSNKLFLLQDLRNK